MNHPTSFRRRLEIPYKEWLHREADAVGIKPHTLHTRIMRGRHPAPPNLRRGPSGRAISVTLIQP